MLLLRVVTMSWTTSYTMCSKLVTVVASTSGVSWDGDGMKETRMKANPDDAPRKVAAKPSIHPPISPYCPDSTTKLLILDQDPRIRAVFVTQTENMF